MVAASTLLLPAIDQDVVDEAQRFADRIGLKGTNRLKTVGNIFGFPIEMPTVSALGPEFYWGLLDHYSTNDFVFNGRTDQ